MPTYFHITDYDADALHTFDGSHVVVTPRYVLFWKPLCPFGQWNLSPFEVDGVRFNCAEQCMMAAKTRLFADEETHDQILAEPDPRRQQRLGRKVCSFQPNEWSRVRCDLVFHGNLAKFTQNPRLKDALLETQGRTLVEASPQDRIWGIDLAANDPRAYARPSWQGLNLLGTVLEQVRNEIGS